MRHLPLLFSVLQVVDYEYDVNNFFEFLSLPRVSIDNNVTLFNIPRLCLSPTKRKFHNFFLTALIIMFRPLRTSRNWNPIDGKRNFVSSSVFGDFQFKSKRKSEIKSSYDVVIVGAGRYFSVKSLELSFYNFFENIEDTTV